MNDLQALDNWIYFNYERKTALFEKSSKVRNAYYALTKLDTSPKFDKISIDKFRKVLTSEGIEHAELIFPTDGEVVVGEGEIETTLASLQKELKSIRKAVEKLGEKESEYLSIIRDLTGKRPTK